MAEIAIYVQAQYSKKTYKRESYDIRKWYGLEIVRDDLERAGFAVTYCSIADVATYRVVLVSITSACDWYSFIAERVRWPSGKYVVVCGGAGVLNIRPVLKHADVFVFGRGEGLVVNLVQNILAGRRLRHESVAWADGFSAKDR